MELSPKHFEEQISVPLKMLAEICRKNDVQFLFTVISPPDDKGFRTQEIHGNAAKDTVMQATAAIKMAHSILNDGPVLFTAKMIENPPPGLIRDPNFDATSFLEALKNTPYKDETPPDSISTHQD